MKVQNQFIKTKSTEAQHQFPDSSNLTNYPLNVQYAVQVFNETGTKTALFNQYFEVVTL